jgi:aminoglycoside phosphotransferase family enzyme/predicted kinase
VEVDRSGFEVLDREECLRLLRTARCGRVALHAGALPVVLPVGFRVDGDHLLIRTGRTTQLGEATRDAVVALEVDDLDPATCSGWSVLVTGVATEITDPGEVERARGLLDHAWGGPAADRFVRITIQLVSGRRRAPAPSARLAATGLAASGAATTTAPPAVAETHSAVVLFLGDRAYKLKKPVDLGFLDFRTPAARRAACHREVDLNRRLAPDVYLGVARVEGGETGLDDHAVVMRRMPDDRRLSTLVRAGEPVEDHLRRLAAIVARFHGEADRSREIDRAGERDEVAARWEADLAQARRFAGDVLDPEVAGRVATLARRYLAGRQPLFAHRIAAGRVLDGHGDLLADDIFCLDDGPRVLDCLEFDDRLRAGDALADAAFLAMDLERLGRPDLGRYFLVEYGRASGDRWPASLAHHYLAYRAHIRSKVACLRWAQGDAASAATAAGLLEMAERHLHAGRVRLVLVGGLPGTGKSTLARGLAGALGAVVLRSDAIRKRSGGLPPDQPAPAPYNEGLYRPEATHATYALLLAEARQALAMGESVVADASWRDPRWRDAAALLAREFATELVELRCTAPLDLAARRIVERQGAGDPSDATPGLLRVLAAEEKPWPSALDLDTTATPAHVLEVALRAVDAAPQPLPVG